MKCKEARAYWETDPRAAINPQTDSVELTMHLAACLPCSRFFEEQKQLSKCLQVIRDSVPVASASLDDAVLAKFRGYLSRKSPPAVPPSLLARIHLPGASGLAVAALFAVGVALGAMLLLIPPQGSSMYPQTAQPPMLAPQPATGSQQMARVQEGPPKRPQSIAAPAKRRKRANSVAEPDSSLATRFQSLMYCDPISCPGAMDLIRVQLPSPILGLTPATGRPNGLISADVLVGPDGIARGIRVVQ